MNSPDSTRVPTVSTWRSYPTTPENALWIVPGMHDQGHIEIKELIDANGGSDELPDAVPLLCEADVALCNRQMLHCSFEQERADSRNLAFGFHRRASVLNVEPARWGGKVRRDEARIHALPDDSGRSDAVRNGFPTKAVRLSTLAREAEANRFNEETRRTVLHNYNNLDLGI